MNMKKSNNLGSLSQIQSPFPFNNVKVLNSVSGDMASIKYRLKKWYN